jgi:hypothetical protein
MRFTRPHPENMNAKSEDRGPKPERITKAEIRTDANRFAPRFLGFIRHSGIRHPSFTARLFVLGLLVAGFGALAGCATSTIEKRRAERSAAYETLTPEHRDLVDQGQVRIGMNQDAVHIAWGRPTQKLNAEGPDGFTETWIYGGSMLEDRRYWTFREYRERDGTVRLDRVLENDYHIRDYVSAEIVFTNSIVKSWRTLPAPAPRNGPDRGY